MLSPATSTDPHTTSSSGSRWERGVAVIVILLCALVVLSRVFLATSTTRLLRAASAALSEDEHREAARLADLVLQKVPDSPQALLIAGYAAAAQMDSAQALEYFGRVPEDGSPASLAALMGSARRFLIDGRLSDADRSLRGVLAIDPGHIEAHRGLCAVLQASSRGWETLAHVLPLIQSGQFKGDHLLMSASTESLFGIDAGFMQRCGDAVPSDPLPQLGKARTALFLNQREDAERLLQEILSTRPDLIEAQSRQGRLLMESGDSAAFSDWEQKLLPEADDHPEIWFVRGLWSAQTGELPSAAGCFREVVVRDPNHLGANYQLSLLLERLGRPAQARVFAERARGLSKLEQLFAEVARDGRPHCIRPVVDELESLGRLWEACGWCDWARRMNAELSWPRDVQRRLYPRLIATSELTDAAIAPSGSVDLSSYELPLRRPFAVESPSEEAAAEQFGPITFDDTAPEVGLEFSYYNGAPTDAELHWAFEFFGGGVGVLDYDGDGWQDIHLSQGCVWPPAETEPIHRDRLFRNLGNGRFQDSTRSARLGNPGFSQGVAAGDYNNDGFADLFVANVGPNRLYLNNGDGTFTDVTTTAGTGGDQWTSSCVIADLNGDAWPDLYCVNYLGGPGIQTAHCERCTPHNYPAEQDRLYLNLGDGQFRDITEQCGIVAPDGKGLGVVVGDFDSSRRLSIFVANDTTANFLFTNETQHRSDLPRFRERGLVSGTALDPSGHAQAGMGVAAGDCDGDGRLDLFVTNYYREANALYVQQSGGLFVDHTRGANLFAAGFDKLGFGTQFLDTDLDGWQDLVVANGHVFNSSTDGSPYQMPPQYFHNVRGRKFVELPAASLGCYFEQPAVGRALARLDWNRDGREDFCTTHLDRPVALLTNRTQDTGDYLRVQLRGVDCDRDAIGTIVRVAAGGKSWTRQLTAGDGYQASNARELIFGLGRSAPRIDTLSVRWPSGLVQEYADIPPNVSVLFVEGASGPLQLPE